LREHREDSESEVLILLPSSSNLLDIKDDRHAGRLRDVLDGHLPIGELVGSDRALHVDVCEGHAVSRGLLPIRIIERGIGAQTRNDAEEAARLGVPVDGLHAEAEPEVRVIGTVVSHVNHLEVLRQLSRHFIYDVEFAVQRLNLSIKLAYQSKGLFLDEDHLVDELGQRDVPAILPDPDDLGLH